MATEKAAPTLIGSVPRALRLLEAVGLQGDGATARQLARRAGHPLVTTFGATLCTIGLSPPVAQAHRLSAAADRLAVRVGAVMDRPSFTI